MKKKEISFLEKKDLEMNTGDLKTWEKGGRGENESPSFDQGRVKGKRGRAKDFLCNTEGKREKKITASSPFRKSAR